MKVIIKGWPRVRQSMVEESPKAKKKRVMEPFVVSPSNKLNAMQTLLNTCVPISKRKVKPIDCLREGIGKSTLKAKNKHKKARATSPLASRKVRKEGERSVQSSLDNEENTSNDDEAK